MTTTKPCRDCRRSIVLLGSPFNSDYRAFNAAPVNGRTHQGATAYPRDGLRTYRFRDLVEELMVRRQCSSADAEAEVYDLDWYVPHTCPERTGRVGGDEEAAGL